MNRIIRETVTAHGGRVIVNNTVLTPEIGNPPVMQWVRETGGRIGFQVNRQIVGCREGSPNPCDREILRQTLRTARDAGAVFVEVHDGNIHRHRHLLRKANRQLGGR